MGSMSVRRALGIATLTAATAVVALFGPGVTRQASAASGSACPSNKVTSNLKIANNVGASFTTSGSITTYQFFSSNENPTGGVAGLMKYCVYPTNPSTPPTAISSLAEGFNNAPWVKVQRVGNFGFVRPGGNNSNIPLDGTTVQMGTATWGTVPATQTVVLHINDASTCLDLYGGTAATCFVRPGLELGPICNAGPEDTTNDVYDAIPRDAVHCAPPSLGFESDAVSEFGNEVTLSSSGGHLASLTVQFQSYACSVSGHWNTGATDPCMSTSNATFTLPITANIYDPSNLTMPIASVTTTQTIPYRPSADPLNCPGAGGNGADDVGSRWFDTVSGECHYSLGTLLTFAFPAGTILPSQVVWTVAFDTSTAGYSPLGTGTACFLSTLGCPYDSLNVGVMDYPNAPFVGSDTVAGGAAIAGGLSADTCAGPVTATLHLVSPCWSGYRPLGEVKVS